MNKMAVNYEEIHDYLIELALEAGAVLTANTGTSAYDDKANAVDLVTAIDASVESLIKSKLRAKYPAFDFIGEESEKHALSDLPTFIIDPIDGTTNFIHAFPFSCISLGLAVNRKSVVGVVHNPHLNTTYSAIVNNGAYLNSTTRLPLTPATPLSLSSALIGIEWGTDRDGTNFKIKTDTFKSLASKQGAMVHGFRSLGSAAQNLCAVASGSLDAYWEGGCYAWDVCAGWIILQEAGGRMVDGNPGNWKPDLEERTYLAVRPGADSEKFITDFWSHIPGKMFYQS
ncbi:hypothetical protein V1512DRAFT_265646 [Lipomyces arxii]|uniref:uncharacterized protein n=1 Tax=Lipomyces arxii TaxID=56418 RepID=UPI0034CE1775